MSSIWVTWPALVKYGTLGITAGLLTLAAERKELFENNLFDFEKWEQYNEEVICDERSMGARTEDGTCNNLENPSEGSVHRRFGRNVELEAAYAEQESGMLLTPNPREVSNTLMARGDDFKPATSVNFIAGAWIQFMTHDWFSHGENTADDPILVELPENDAMGSGVMSVRRTQVDTSRTADEEGLPLAYRNANTHWWDGSQIYGSDLATSNSIREFEGGRLTVNSDGSLPTEFFSGVPVTGFTENWWVGLSMLHQLFVQEHNSIAQMLASNNPDKDDQWLYDKARLINSALMAKIHTVEWTPAIIANPVTERAMYANWWGLVGNTADRDKYAGEFEKLAEDLAKTDSWVRTILGLDSNLEQALNDGTALEWAVTGLAGARSSDNAGVPFTLTEEFVAVYRMHPLMRDNIDVYDIGSNIVRESIPIVDTRDGDAETVLDEQGIDRLWYSFGITNPGSLTLNNFPEFLRNLDLPVVGKMDIATIDILRDRERGVPRYNEFRRQIGLVPITKFEDLTDDAETVANLRRVYNDDVEQLDVLVGMLGETVRPEGFAFGETAFQIFIMNASRRIITDRFFTSDYNPEVYTQEGYDWVEYTTMVDVLNRHNPELAVSLTGVENAFKPWGLNVPENYESWDACTKQDLLWTNGAVRTEYAEGELPAIPPIDIGGLIDGVLWDKVNYVGDVAPVGHTKPIHPHGVMAKVVFNATSNHPYTGVFKGNECGLLRLSVTGDPADRGFAPGFAWKTFIDGKPSENVSALYTLSGQEDNYNFFANELSQYVRVESNITLATTTLFSLVSSKPTLVMVDAMAGVNSDGSAVAAPKSPTQVYFVPSAEVAGLFSSDEHDFRADLMSLPEGTKLYDVYATDKEIKTSIWSRTSQRYADERRASAVKVGELVMDSNFTASQFGDSGVFFKHQRYEDK
ncbi:peroxidase [Thalassolituus oleivorans]|uniref:peroxidase family protein n=1 Tax=Thalassolituus oleivorans TaxID=187493 RepID=UPI0009493694|nr:peroxidase family protein [Thalassolituus oleivorans]APR68659.1 peroxidase [Thalassolituus oleivorans]